MHGSSTIVAIADGQLSLRISTGPCSAQPYITRLSPGGHALYLVVIIASARITLWQTALTSLKGHHPSHIRPRCVPPGHHPAHHLYYEPIRPLPPPLWQPLPSTVASSTKFGVVVVGAAIHICVATALCPTQHRCAQVGENGTGPRLPWLTYESQPFARPWLSLLLTGVTTTEILDSVTIVL